MLSPSGKAGDISQVAAMPPLFENETEGIEASLVKMMLFCEAAMLAAGSLMVKVTMVKALPPELLAQMVKLVVLMLTVGSPEILPLMLLKDKPLGRAG